MKKWVLIKDTLGFSINEDGDIVNLTTGEKRAVIKAVKDGRLMINLPYQDGKRRANSVAFLLAQAFIPVPEELKDRARSIFFKDGDVTNHKLDNLEWVPKGHQTKLNFKKTVSENKVKYDVPTSYPRGRKGEPYLAIECKQKPGFYYVPYADHPLVINKEGVLFNLDTQKEVSWYPGHGYLENNTRFRGEYRTTKQHRLLAQLFIPLKRHHEDYDFNNLEVNHINGKKDDNRLVNLEWCTSGENLDHALKTGLIRLQNIIAKDIRTGYTAFFRGHADCAKVYGITDKRLKRHLLSPEIGRVTKNWTVFSTPEVGFPKLDPLEMEENTWDRDYGVWVARHSDGRTRVANTKKEIVEAISEPVEMTPVDDNTYSAGRWLIQFDTEPASEMIAGLKGRFVNKGIYEGIKVTLFDTLTGQATEYASATQAGRAIGIDSKTITTAMKAGVMKMFKGRWTWSPEQTTSNLEMI